jgi:hypothetical protein
LAEPQDIPPGRILNRLLDAEMVGHDVDDHPEARQARTRHEPFQTRFAAAIMVDMRYVGRVVTMIGTDRGLQYR